MRIGYARVSTADQNLDRQMDALREAGCERIYEEKISGAKKERPELRRMLDAVRAGDIVVVTELARLGRSVSDLFTLVEEVHNAGADVISLKEPWLDTTTPHGRLLFTFFSGISQFERDLIRQRTAEGLAAARARGRMGGRPSKEKKDIERAIKLYKSKSCTLKEITEMTGIGKTWIYKYLKDE